MNTGHASVARLAVAFALLTGGVPVRAGPGNGTYYANSTTPTLGVKVGNPTVGRAVTSDATPTVLVINPAVLPTGLLQSIDVFDQNTTAAPFSFHAYVLRPGAAGTYSVVYDTGPLTVTTTAAPGVVRSYPTGSLDSTGTFVPGIAIKAGDRIAHYGQGVPYDTVVGGADVVASPAPAAPVVGTTITVSATSAAFPLCGAAACGTRTSSIGATVDANGLRKFVNRLPGLGLANANELGQYLPVAVPAADPRWPKDDYYEIDLVEYTEQMHADLPPTGVDAAGNPTYTHLRGYVQVKNGVQVAKPSYLGPIIVGTAGRPVRIKFTNRLAKPSPIPIDATIMGAGAAPGAPGETYSDKRATIHLHGGYPPWIADGTAHQWITPANDAAAPTQKKGVSVVDIPDMPATAANDGTMYFYWPNAQTSRLLFYHDHALGITRVNVYAGEAAGYVLTDGFEQDLIAGSNTTGLNPSLAKVPDLGIPIVFQDKTFVPENVAVQDALWSAAWGKPGDLWFPHVYEPNQLGPPVGGVMAVDPRGRWDYGPFMWPPAVVTNKVLPQPSIVPESFMDSAVVNGTVYPYLEVDPTTVRLRVLNAANDRTVNFNLVKAQAGTTYVADPAGALCNPTPPDVQCPCTVTGNHADALFFCDVQIPDPNTLGAMLPVGINAGSPLPVPAPLQTLSGEISGNVVTVQAGTNISSKFYPDFGPAMIQIGTEGGYLPRSVPHVYPLLDPLGTPAGPGATWPTPLPPGFVVTPTSNGQLVTFDLDRKSATFGNVKDKSLFLGPAERADVLVDLSAYAGQTLILYNDAPAPVPLLDPRYDYFTGDGDQSAIGGAPNTLAGYGPNTRTVMQIRVREANLAATPPAPVNVAALDAALGRTFAASTGTAPNGGVVALPAASVVAPNDATGIQPAKLVPDSALATDPMTGVKRVQQIRANNRLQTGSTFPDPAVFLPADNPGLKYYPVHLKAIAEDFDLVYGRMNALLGNERSSLNTQGQQTFGLPFVAPPSEIFDVAPSFVNTTTPIVPDGDTQIWMVVHNGVDTHAIHFHLVNVQVVNRVDWAGVVKDPDPNELGWKDTVRMNPLENVILAVQAKPPPNVPFVVPDSVRPLDVTMPASAMNPLWNLKQEYVWHCHLLGHEENDMMRPLISAAGGTRAVGVIGAPGATATVLSRTTVRVDWTAPVPNTATAVTVERAPALAGPWTVLTSTLPGTATTFTDATALPATAYVYRVTTLSAAGPSVPTLTAVVKTLP